MSETVDDTQQGMLERVRSPEVFNLVQQHLPADYKASIDIDPNSDVNDEPIDAELNVRWAPPPLREDTWPIVGSAKLRVADVSAMTVEQIAQQILDLVGTIARRGKDFGDKWDKQHGEATSAMQVASTWEESMRFRCKLAAGRINKRLQAGQSAEIVVPYHGTEILSPTYYQTVAILTVKNSEGGELLKTHALLCSSERNSADEITNYFCKYTNLKQIRKPDVKEDK